MSPTTISGNSVIPFPFVMQPLTQITPFSYRDGMTYAKLQENLRLYMDHYVIPEFNDKMEAIFQEFQDGIANSESRYEEFVQAIAELVEAINNRVGPESIQRVTLASDQTVNIDPTWPTAHPVRFQFTQDVTGGHVVSFGASVIGSAWIDPDPFAMTEVELIPDGAGTWMIHTLNKPEAINVAKDFGARPGGAFDNTAAFNAAADRARITGQEIFIPSGVWYVAGEVNISGVVFRGLSRGYEGRGKGGDTVPVDAAATIIRGSGNNIVFNQQNVAPLSRVRCGLHGVRIENCKTGLRVSYSVYSHFTDVIVIDSTGHSIICGDITIIGPLWNIFERCMGKSLDGYGLVLSGKDWCNANVFETCFFKGTTGAINMTSASGFGSIVNEFRNTEITSMVGPGVVFNGKNRSTTLNKCFIESRGPGIVVNDSTSDLQLIGNAYGSTRNNIVGYGPYFIDHKLSNLSVRITGGWVTTGAIPEQTDLRLIGSALPASLILEFIAEPRLETASTGFKLFDEATISAAETVHRGNLLVKKYSAPQISISYADGTRLFVIKRNGVQGDLDYGVAFVNGGITCMTMLNSGTVVINSKLALGGITAATTPGTLKGKVLIYDVADASYGYLHLFAGTS